jgi:hypothetical protein
MSSTAKDKWQLVEYFKRQGLTEMEIADVLQSSTKGVN